jgi:CDP-diacylglycerol--glycerol-3-phosphate 3-phosphatidyltransferase
VPSIYDIKPRFQSLLRPMVGALVRNGVTPNQLTLLAAAGSVVVGGLLLLAQRNRAWLLLLPLWLLARMALNAMDGMAAREHAMTSRLGAALNELGDVVSDLALYLPLATLGASLMWPVVEFSGLLGQALGGKRRYDGPMGKSDRAFVIGALSLLAVLFPRTLAWWPAAFGIAAASTAITSVNRVRSALSDLERGAR